jgi:glyoxylase-like metal-dependent hydrolase (beta-lactamase superfamily II)
VLKLDAKPAEILQVTDNIYRITLNQPFYAPNQVYLIRDEVTMLIDSGYVESIGSLALALKHLGLSMRQVDVILYTHPHIDHITAGLLWSSYAKRTERWGHHTMALDIPDYPDFIDVWQADTARILTVAFRDKQARNTRIRKANDRWAKFVRRFAEAQDVPRVARGTDAGSASEAQGVPRVARGTDDGSASEAQDVPRVARGTDAGSASEAQEVPRVAQSKDAQSAIERPRKQGDRHVQLDRLLKDGDQFSTGKLNFRILETPGHNTWHITPIETSQGFAFTGDLLIGNIPAIYDTLDGNLELFQLSLAKLVAERQAMPQMRFMPAHGEEILQPERAIKVVLKTIGILENGILKKLVEGRKGLVDLMESAFGAHIEGGNHFITALELLEALLRKLMREGRVGSQVYIDGYEEFYLKH